jgi:hypothetical protein
MDLTGKCIGPLVFMLPECLDVLAGAVDALAGTALGGDAT